MSRTYKADDEVKMDFSRDMASKSPLIHNRILVLCIDRDDDIGSKGGVKTPIIGKESCIDAGIRLALEDPEDADANAIFGAIKMHQDLLAKGYDTEVAVVAGKINLGIEADEKIGFEIQTVLDNYAADGAVLVSDGEDDETIIPVIRTILPIISVQRVIIRHSRSVQVLLRHLGEVHQDACLRSTILKILFRSTRSTPISIWNSYDFWVD